jgi:hypothetical protein
MSQWIIEIDTPEDEALLMQLLPKFGARIISKISSDTEIGKPNKIGLIEPFLQFDGKYYYDTIELDQDRYDELKSKYSNAINKNNSDVGKLATEIVADYLLSKIPDSKIRAGVKGADLELVLGYEVEPLEIKGTTSNTISWPKLKVSSRDCYNGLVNGMTMIRVVNADTKFPKLYFLKHGRDFRMAPEDRWSVHPSKATI